MDLTFLEECPGIPLIPGTEPRTNKRQDIFSSGKELIFCSERNFFGAATSA